MAVSVIYKDIAPYAKANCTVTASEKQDFVNLSDLAAEELPSAYATFEPNLWLLDGSTDTFPDTGETGYYSVQTSGADGSFETPIVITRTFEGIYKSIGMTFKFDALHGDYCNSLNIKWYYNDELVANGDFEPNAPVYFCNQPVEMFDKTVITFYSLNRADRYLKIMSVDDGKEVTFTDSSLISASVLHEISPISESLPVNTMTCELVTDDNLTFQAKQPFNAYYNNSLLGVFFIDTVKRTAKNRRSITAVDYIGMLDKATFNGGYYTNKPFAEFVSNVLENMYSLCIIAEELRDIKLSGYLPVTTAREALQQACFAVGAVVSTANSGGIKITKQSGEIKTVEDGNIFADTDMEESDVVTKIELTLHEFAADAAQSTIFKGSLSEKTLIKFDGGYTNILSSTCTINESGANYAIVTPNTSGSEVKLIGNKINDYTTVISLENTDVISGTNDNVISVTNAAFINAGNASETAARLFDYYVGSNKITTQIVLNGEKVGERVKIRTPFDTYVTGTITRLDLSGAGKLIGQAVINIEQ